MKKNSYIQETSEPNKFSNLLSQYNFTSTTRSPSLSLPSQVSRNISFYALKALHTPTTFFFLSWDVELMLR